MIGASWILRPGGLSRGVPAVAAVGLVLAGGNGAAAAAGLWGGPGASAAAGIVSAAGGGFAGPAPAARVGRMAAPARQATSGGGWGTAIEVPGSAALNVGGNAAVSSVSCAAIGSCSAGGDYADSISHPHTFVVTERNGRWGQAIAVPGLAALSPSGSGMVFSVSCAAAGSCAAGGNYADSPGHSQAFVVTKANGRWGQAIEVPGLAALNTGGNAEVLSVSCAAAGSCAAGGEYTDAPVHFQGFVVTETNGRWGQAIEVPRLAALNAGELALVTSVSCAAAGDCSAGGTYTDGTGHGHGFVVTETNGRWGQAIEVPGLAALNAGGNAVVTSVSCAAAGSCSAVGRYRDGTGHGQAFVVTETDGRWGKAIEVPGLAALNIGNAEANSVSCAAAGSCSAGGFYIDGAGHAQAFVATQTNGRWGRAIEVPGSATLNAGGAAGIDSVSCAAAGSCSAGGFYRDGTGDGQAFVATETNGRWGRAIEVPGSAALNAGGSAVVGSVSCATASSCSAGGQYRDGSARFQAFVVSKT